MTTRPDGRGKGEMRKVLFLRDYTRMTPGSVLACYGSTRVLCTVSFEDRVPPWLRGTGQGWITSEYSLLPGSTSERVSREAAKGRLKGRTQEIQRLIGRSLRAVSNLSGMGECSLYVDCDVLQADGGTRTASVSGACLALHDAGTRLVGKGMMMAHPLRELCAAVSVGVVKGEAVLDLPYEEDSAADVDMNLVMAESGKFIEVQGTAEGATFSSQQMQEMLALGEAGIAQIIQAQKAYLSESLSPGWG